MDPVKLIVADVGGTNGRFAVAAVSESGAPEILVNQTYECASFGSFAEMLRTFIADHNLQDIEVAQIALAGHTSPTECYMTNTGWRIKSEQLKEETGLRQIAFMNDFAAVASAIPYLKSDGYLEVKPGEAEQEAPISVMGPGTGFGVSLLVPVGERHQVISTEGGHVAFAPTTHLEQDLLKHLKNERGHVCVESLLSGRGLVRIHDFLVHYAGSGEAGIGPEEISRRAAESSIPSCVRAVQLFLSVLGSVAGDMALAHGARGGVWIAGGIVPKIYNFIESSDLVSRFSSKGVMSGYTESIPIKLVVDSDAAFVGAAMAWQMWAD